MYSERVLDHFHNPRNVGELDNATAVVEASNPACGDVMKLWVVVQGGKVVEARFKTAGCVPAVACGSWLTEWIMGKPVADLHTLTTDQIEVALEGLPPASKHAAMLAVEVLKTLLAKVGKR